MRVLVEPDIKVEMLGDGNGKMMHSLPAEVQPRETLTKCHQHAKILRK